MTLPSDAVPQLPERAPGPLQPASSVAEGGPDRVPELLQRAPEDLPRRLELRSQAEEAEVRVPAHVQAAAELVEEEEHRDTGALIEPRDPGLQGLAVRSVHAMMLFGA